MRITIFSQHFWPENFRINDIAKKLKLLGVKLNVFTGKPNYPDGVISDKFKSFFPIEHNFKGINILRFPIIARGKASSVNLFLNYISFVISATFFSFFFRKKFGDIFFVYGTSPIFQAIPVIILKKFFKIKLVLWVQDLWPDNLKDTGYVKNLFILKFVDYLVKKIYFSSDLILCQSDAFKKEIKKKTSTKLKILYNPSNYKFDFKLKKKKSFFDIYYTGNLGYGQNFDKILETFKDKKVLNEKIRLIIFGSGKNFYVIKKKIKDSNSKNIILKKAVSPSKLKIFMKNADCFILILNKGLGLSKTIPAKFQTYLSFGKPIISVNSGIVSELIQKHKLGFWSSDVNTKNLRNILFKSKKLSEKQLIDISKKSKRLFMKKFEINSTCIKLKKYLEDLE